MELERSLSRTELAKTLSKRQSMYNYSLYNIFDNWGHFLDFSFFGLTHNSFFGHTHNHDIVPNNYEFDNSYQRIPDEEPKEEGNGMKLRKRIKNKSCK